jgi:LCP family protein required for cell wall assembly
MMLSFSTTGQRSGRRSLFLDKPSNKRRGCCVCIGCLPIIAVIILLITIIVYINAPGRTNILILGIDSRDQSTLGRSDTMILTTFMPSKPYVGMLSIPRDLWVEIPDYGYNRINVANFLGEANEPGSGPYLVIETIQHNFGIDVDYYVRINLFGFLELIDSLGGIDIAFPNPTSGYEAGLHHLNGEQALAVVRDRANSDDFSRMERGQIVVKALINTLIKPSSWLKIPATTQILIDNLETNVPFWRWLQFPFTVLRIGINNIDNRTIDRTMVSPFTSEGGAAVLAPRWEEINRVLLEMFEQ